MATTQHITTAEQLLQAGDLGPCELVRGELVMMTPAGFEHGEIGLFIGARLLQFVREHHLGRVAGLETGFHIAKEPDTVRAPDVGFVRTERVPPGRRKAFFHGPPDLAVEVLSPRDRPGEVAEKVADWLRAGCLEIWVVNPDDRTVTVHRPKGEPVVLRGSDVLEGGDLLPGFRLPLSEIFSG